MEFTYQDYDEGRRFFIPVTLREIEAADIQLNSAMGINASEHGELLDKPGIVRICVELAVAQVEDNQPPTANTNADVEVFCNYLDGHGARWGSGLQILNPYQCGGEPGLREANQRRQRMERAAKLLAYRNCPELERAVGVLGRRWERLAFEDWEYNCAG